MRVKAVQRSKLIAIIEDEEPVRQLLSVVLTDAGFGVAGASDGPSGLRLVKERQASLVLLDYALPGPGGMTGLDVCRALRADEKTADVPILVLTGRGDDRVQVEFLEAGADDYIEKRNFKADVLIARIEAVLRRVGPAETDAIVHGALSVHPGRHEVRVNDVIVNLTPTEFSILHKLARNRDRTLTRADLLDRGGGDPEGVDRTVDVHVLSIRRKLDKHAWLVQTVWGVGYRLGSEARA